MAKPILCAVFMTLYINSCKAQDIPNQQPLSAPAEPIASPQLIKVTCSGSCNEISLHNIVPSRDSKGDVKCCPAGTFFNGVNCAAKPTTPPSCPDSMTLDGGIFTQKQSPFCPPGFVFDEQSKSCSHQDGPKCPAGSSFSGRVCISVNGPQCKEGIFKGGMSWDESSKLCFSAPTGSNSCPQETTLQNGKCAFDPGEVDCPGGFTFNGHNCAFKSPPGCMAGVPKDGIYSLGRKMRVKGTSDMRRSDDTAWKCLDQDQQSHVSSRPKQYRWQDLCNYEHAHLCHWNAQGRSLYWQ
ncbi:tenascin X precursor [Fusarium pseudocircinatum]|uniref:Tenascin X n=1 Tax=Fusarium pseudocircinatum TaxID=56676 RepID=A0A8H5LGB4_9HYPO|nr:tenascin X precursor [Fusarium pseudocircinatum]